MSLLGGGPSLKTWPRCAPPLASMTSTRGMKGMLVSLTCKQLSYPPIVWACGQQMVEVVQTGKKFVWKHGPWSQLHEDAAPRKTCREAELSGPCLASEGMRD